MPTMRFSCTMPADAQTVFGHFICPALLAKNSSPLLSLRFPTLPPSRWAEGDRSEFDMYLLGFIPLGRHEVHFVTLDENRLHYITSEKGKQLTTWKHEFSVTPISDVESLCESTITFEAGPGNRRVQQFGNILYPFRNFQWKRHFRKLNSSH